jgi:dipeptidyl aminopeptidase/acylaminoacyl peptidase
MGGGRHGMNCRIGRRLVIWVVAAVLLAFSPLTEAFDTQEFLQRTSISDVTLAPNGARVLYRVSRADLATNARSSRLWVRSLNDRKAVEVPIDGGQAFAWQRDASGFLFADGEGAVHEWDMRDSSDRVVLPASKLLSMFPNAQSVLVREIDIAPKGDLVAITTTITDRIDPHPLKGVEVDTSWSLNPDASRPAVLQPPATTTVLLLDLRSKEVSRILPEEFEVTLDFWGQGLDWSPDGRRLAFAASKIRPHGATWNFMSSDLYMVDISTRDIRLLVSEPGVDFHPFWSPDGTRIAFSTMAGKFDWKDWQYTFQIGLVDLSGKEPHVWFPFAGTPEDPRTRWLNLGGWSTDSKEFYFVAPVRGHSEMLGLNIKTGRLRSLPHPADANADLDRWISDWRTARHADLAVFQRSDFNHAPDLYAWRRSDASIERLTNLNPSINDHPYAHVESVTWPSADGKWDLQGFLLTPIHALGGKLPLIAEVVGGPGMVYAGAVWLPTFTYLPEPTFLDHGYAVFLPNTRGRYGFGEAFNRSLHVDQSMNRVAATDVISGVNHLIERGRIDPRRVGIAGYSYGGGVTAYAVALNQMFRAAVIDEGVFLNPWDHFDSEPNRAGWAHMYGASSPFDPSIWPLLLKDSPSEVVSSIKTPILLGFGIDSEAQTQGRPFYAALQAYRVPSEFIIYPRSGHSTMEPVLVIDGYQRKLEWFDYWLKGIPSDRMRERYGEPNVLRIN